MNAPELVRAQSCAGPLQADARTVVHARRGENLMLMPGELSFGGNALRMRTLLGSCVAITVWHPERHIGGMCHYLLPSRRRLADAPLEGRFGDEALELLVRAMRRSGANPGEFQAHLYGGADTMPDHAETKFNIGERNIEAGWTMIDAYGFSLCGVDVGDNVPRTVTLHLPSGEVEMRRGTGGAATRDGVRGTK